MSLPLAQKFHESLPDGEVRTLLRAAQQFDCAKIAEIARDIVYAQLDLHLRNGPGAPYPEGSRLPAPAVWLEFEYRDLDVSRTFGLLLSSRSESEVQAVSVFDEGEKIVMSFLGRYRPGERYTEIHREIIQAGGAKSADTLCRLAAQMVACITHPKLCDQTARSESRQVQRQKARSDGFSVEWRDVSIRNTVHGKAGDSEAATRPLHFVLGHFKSAQPHHPKARNINGRWLTWIEGYWRGNPAVGIRLHRYHPASPPTTEASAAGP